MCPQLQSAWYRNKIHSPNCQAEVKKDVISGINSRHTNKRKYVLNKQQYLLRIECKVMDINTNEELNAVNKTATKLSCREAMNTAWCQFSQSMQQ